MGNAEVLRRAILPADLSPGHLEDPKDVTPLIFRKGYDICLGGSGLYIAQFRYPEVRAVA